jgi:hypothetical protein
VEFGDCFLKLVRFGESNVRLSIMARLICRCFLVVVSCVSVAQTDPYVSLTANDKAILKPSIEMYIHDQLKQNWSDLWEIQDQTSDLKSELLLGNRTALDMTKEQFVGAMKEMISNGSYPVIREFELSSVRADNGNFVVIGCAKATRESWHQTGFVVFGAKIVDGKPKFDIWRMTSNSCSDKN